MELLKYAMLKHPDIPNLQIMIKRARNVWFCGWMITKVSMPILAMEKEKSNVCLIPSLFTMIPERMYAAASPNPLKVLFIQISP